LPLPLVALFWYYTFMARSITVIPKRPGRPATGRDPVMSIRLGEALAARVDEWASKNGADSRSDAIRRLLDEALPTPKAKR
jgi:hypothetical protein